MSRFIVAADVGGTKARFGLFEVRGDELDLVLEKTYASGRYDGLGPMVAEFLAMTGREVDALSVGLAGPVQDGRCRTPNLPWLVDVRDLELLVPGKPVWLINDLLATATALPRLPDERFVSLTPDLEPAPGNACLIAPGTGLGEAILFWDGHKHVPSASEGGHTDFAPRNETEWRLREWLARQYGHVSYERIVSGPGLLAIYRFLLATDGDQEPEVVTNEDEDPSALIAQHALDGRSRRCARALDLFVGVLGAEAGNLALKALAVGGVYLGGGIPPKILTALRSGPFLEAFLDKGRMRHLVARMPVKVMDAPEAALWGAAWHAGQGLEP
ncbi:MAG: glucokinase [Proteobacteria bacterium]|nr:glucokinase [Pseudomonadota bacterium]